MLTTILYIYLTGWIGISGYGLITCDENTYRMSKSECRTLHTVGGAVWPAAVVVGIKDKIQD